MALRSFWQILIKILGIYVAIESITTIWKSINIIVTYASFASFATLSPKYHLPFDTVEFAALTSLILFIVYLLIFYFFLFKTDWIIDKLKLEKGFHEERFELNTSNSTILKIVVMIIGGYLLVDIFPTLISDVITYFQPINKYEIREHNRNTVYIITNIIKIGIGVYMLTCSTSIVSFIEKRSRKNPNHPIS